MPSSVIASFTYNQDKQILQIRFVSGIRYNYKNVPEEVYKEMKNTFSKGIFFNEYVKDKFDFEKVDE